MTANEEHARRLVAEADACMSQRKALLCASVVLATTASIPAARKALRAWNGPASIKTAAIELLATTGQETAP